VGGVRCANVTGQIAHQESLCLSELFLRFRGVSGLQSSQSFPVYPDIYILYNNNDNNNNYTFPVRRLGVFRDDLMITR
jgi:hypothetical protein